MAVNSIVNNVLKLDLVIMFVSTNSSRI